MDSTRINVEPRPLALRHFNLALERCAGVGLEMGAPNPFAGVLRGSKQRREDDLIDVAGVLPPQHVLLVDDQRVVAQLELIRRRRIHAIAAIVDHDTVDTRHGLSAVIRLRGPAGESNASALWQTQGFFRQVRSCAGGVASRTPLFWALLGAHDGTRDPAQMRSCHGAAKKNKNAEDQLLQPAGAKQLHILQY